MSVAIVLILCALLAVFAAALIRVKDLFATVAFLSAYSGLVALLLAVLGAVDVAFTEAVVGAGVSTVFLIGLLRRVDPTAVGRPGPWGRAAALLMVCGLAGILLVSAHSLPKFGDPEAVANRHVSPDYIARSIDDMATPNVVTAVLADYRGFDTLIETAVIATAALATILILGRKP